MILAVRVRNIKQAYEYIKQQDSETALTESAFRSIVKGGLIPSFSIGIVVAVEKKQKQEGIRKQNVKG